MVEMKEALEILKETISHKKETTEQKEQESYRCNLCRDTGMEVSEDEDGHEVAKRCKCAPLRDAHRKMSRSGLGDLLNTKTFDNYEVTNGYQKAIRDSAIEYVKEFKEGNRHSFAILGQSGVGKTHITAAIARILLNEGISVKYFIGDEITQNLQACKYDEENYNKEFNKIISADVLVIDDLFKSSITNYYKEEGVKQEDLREIFKVINYRYNKNLPIILNSEIHFERFTEIDQAIIGRVSEMCNYKYLLSIKPDAKKNYRLNARSF